MEFPIQKVTSRSPRYGNSISNTKSYIIESEVREQYFQHKKLLIAVRRYGNRISNTRNYFLRSGGTGIEFPMQAPNGLRYSIEWTALLHHIRNTIPLAARALSTAQSTLFLLRLLAHCHNRLRQKTSARPPISRMASSGGQIGSISTDPFFEKIAKKRTRLNGSTLHKITKVADP